MHAAYELNNDQNRCWFCKRNNPSKQLSCICRAAITSTQDQSGKLIYHTYSFGCNSKNFPSVQRLREGLLHIAVQLLEDSVLVVVRVGSISHFAIRTKDADGCVRSGAKTPASGLQLNITKDEFLQASYGILISHVDRTAAEASLCIPHCLL